MSNNNDQTEVMLGGGSIKEFLGPKELKEGQKIAGIYQGTFVCGPYKTVTHKIETETGLVGLNGSGMLNKKLAMVEPGANVTVVYEGTQPIEKGRYKGTKAHQFRVLTDNVKTKANDEQPKRQDFPIDL
jgi:hypothetical protein